MQPGGTADGRRKHYDAERVKAMKTHHKVGGLVLDEPTERSGPMAGASEGH